MAKHLEQHQHNEHHHHSEVSEKTINKLLGAFAINIFLSAAEIIAGLIAGSIALIADALHNTFDAFSILIAVVSFKIGKKQPDSEYTFGYKRAETLGGFINLILLFVSGLYLFVEGISRLIKPEQINGSLIIWVSVLALAIDLITAKLSHHGAHASSNMKMLFLHNIADAFGSIGVIISGLCVLYLNWTFVDGIVAILIALYMVFQAVISFKPIAKILMNAMPEDLSIAEIEKAIKAMDGVEDIHHIHVWNIDEKKIAFACHAIISKPATGIGIKDMLKREFNIEHTTIQIEEDCSHCDRTC